ncbi:hypothetical protein RvY_13622 [Ramazzottius varieornatus]|uniref:Uncharacterized protein n=1 Tax=Ramazzottius varieornatus TaxID=947166 RepID=A0A1D1VSJ6_RAMVA|nr:hypothetical protein RvY_13622 [Ramazzottius varieornatus]
MESVRRFIRQILRVKTLNFEYFRYRDVPRYKSLLHLLVQGLGSGNAIGIYVFISTAARVHSGPAIVLSALIVGLIAWIVGKSCRQKAASNIHGLRGRHMDPPKLFPQVAHALSTLRCKRAPLDLTIGVESNTDV